MIWKDVLSCHGTDDDVCDGDGDEWRHGSVKLFSFSIFCVAVTLTTIVCNDEQSINFVSVFYLGHCLYGSVAYHLFNVGTST